MTDRASVDGVGPGGANGRGRDVLHAPGRASGLRVLHVVSSLRRGGMETMVVRLAGQQRRGGIDASVLAIWGGPLADEARARGIPVHLVERDSRLARVARTSALVATLAPEVIHAHNPTSLQFATLARMVAESLAGLRRDDDRCAPGP